MDQTQPRGDFVAFLNRDKKPGDKQPAFEGRIAKPGTEEKRAIALWAHEYTDPKTGEVKIMFNGSAEANPTGAAVAEQIAALVQAAPEAATLNNLAIAGRQIVLFPNGFKDEAPDKARPDFWGAYNPGDGTDLVRISVWTRTDRNGRAYLSGATQYPIPGKTEAEMQKADDGLAELLDRGDVTQGMPEEPKRKGRSGRG
jgi:hypothetical protein